MKPGIAPLAPFGAVLVLFGRAAVAAPAQTEAAAPSSTFNARAFGAVGNGTTMETAALNRAVDACAKTGGGTVVLPPGRYLTGTVTLQSHVTFEIEAGATLIASTDPADYPLEPDAFDPTRQIRSPIIDAHDAENITLTGRGAIDGQGAVWWRRQELAVRKPSAGTLGAAEQAEADKVANGRPHIVTFIMSDGNCNA